MEAKSFIINKLRKLSAKYPDFSFTYFTEETMGNHFIEVNPSDFTQSDVFLDDEVDFIDEFYSLFINDSLAFVSSEQLSMVQNLVKVESIFTPVDWLKVGLRNHLLKQDLFSTDAFTQKVESPYYHFALAA